MAPETNGNKWLIPAMSMIVGLVISVGGYNINLNLQNEARITKIETEAKQIRTEMNDVWSKYNSGLEQKETYHITIVLLNARLEVIEREIQNLKR